LADDVAGMDFLVRTKLRRAAQRVRIS